MERKKYIPIEAHKILCSKECESLKLSEDQKVISLERELHLLKEENIHLKKVNSQTQKCTSDQINVDQLKKDEQIHNSKRKIEELMTRNSILLNQIAKMEVDHQQMKLEINEFKTTKNSMITSIETLSAENEVLHNDLVKLRDEHAKLKNGSVNIKDQAIKLNEKLIQVDRSQVGRMRHESCLNQKKRQLLIISDELGRGLNKSLTEYLGKSNFIVQSFIKPGASYHSTMDNIEDLTRNFTSNDYILIMTGSNDFISNQNPSLRFILNKIEKCSNTNIIFSATPVTPDNIKNSRWIQKFNYRLQEKIVKVNNVSENKVCFLDITKENMFKLRNKEIADKVITIINNNKYNKNLVYVKLNHSEEAEINQPLDKNITETIDLDCISTNSKTVCSHNNQHFLEIHSVQQKKLIL